MNRRNKHHVGKPTDSTDPSTITSRRHRTPHELHEIAIEWVRATGWATRDRDLEIARDVYANWMKATDAEWAQTQSRDYELLDNLLREAFLNLHDEDGIDSLQILFTLELTLRGRREGKLTRHRNH